MSVDVWKEGTITKLTCICTAYFSYSYISTCFIFIVQLQAYPVECLTS